MYALNRIHEVDILNFTKLKYDIFYQLGSEVDILYFDGLEVTSN